MVTLILFIFQRGAQLRIRRQPATGRQVKTIRRAFIEILKIPGLMPARDTEVGVGRQFQIIGPCLSTDTGTLIAAGDIVVKEHVGAVHPVSPKQPHAGAGIQGVAAVMATTTGLNKGNITAVIVKREQQIKGAVVQGQMRVKPQLNAGGSELVKPLVDSGFTTGNGGGAGLRDHRIADLRMVWPGGGLRQAGRVLQ